MKTLATDVWKNDDRIVWCYETLKDYFFEGGLQRSIRRLWRRDGRQGHPDENINDAFRKLNLDCEKPLVLDVGSCYNPFKVYTDIDTVAIDLTPASDDVLQCDFLQVEVTDPSSSIFLRRECLKSPLVHLPSESFHVVLFVLVLEYLPCTIQRWTFCTKAVRLLKPNGLLLIVTPDSKHQQKNSAMIRSWRGVLESVGLCRIRYEKRQHLHCMAFQKNNALSVSKDDAETSMYIPQDSIDYVRQKREAVIVERSDVEDKALVETFSQLPQGFVDAC
ncbi:S-adenosylmethionine sensor upstream of mTORC1-like isoform X2 [Ornithodoros turicata]